MLSVYTGSLIDDDDYDDDADDDDDDDDDDYDDDEYDSCLLGNKSCQ